jgi:hypothetical protein
VLCVGSWVLCLVLCRGWCWCRCKHSKVVFLVWVSMEIKNFYFFFFGVVSGVSLGLSFELVLFGIGVFSVLRCFLVSFVCFLCRTFFYLFNIHYTGFVTCCFYHSWWCCHGVQLVPVRSVFCGFFYF